LKNETISWLGSVDGLKELKEVKENVEICERRSAAPLEGAVHVWVRANNTFAGPMNRTGTPSATIGRSHSRLRIPCQRHEWCGRSKDDTSADILLLVTFTLGSFEDEHCLCGLAAS
jgi:hypothetical protein